MPGLLPHTQQRAEVDVIHLAQTGAMTAASRSSPLMRVMLSTSTRFGAGDAPR